MIAARPGRGTRARIPLSRQSVLLAAGAGVVAGAVGIAAGELVAGLIPGAPSLVIAVGSAVIALQPPGAKELVATVFGTNDKTALNVAVVVVALLVAAVAGMMGRRSFGTSWRILAAFGFIGFVAAAVQPLDSIPLAAINAALATAAAIGTLRILMAEAGFMAPARLGGAGADEATGRLGSGGAAAPVGLGAALDRPTGAASMPAWSRRRFLVRSAIVLLGAVAAGALGRLLLDRQHPAAAPVATALPAPAEAVAQLPAAASLSAPAITPIVMPNDQFYRIDTALLVPQVDVSTWQLKVTGMVDHPLTFTYPELLALPLFEQYVTLACVSNVVGGNLVGNTLWTGAHLKPILAQAGVQPGATQIVGRSVDGFTVGFPASWALAPDREPMIAVGMNRVPLPADHGYPARLIIPGLYGYVSATKWLAEIELTTREAFDGYWIPLGWAKDGPILTESRIDHPSDGDSFAAGSVEIDGLAWAPERGVKGVEVRIDNGPWQAAELSRAISKATWVQWLLAWQATPGTHTIAIRATDGAGAAQTETRGGPAPAGATGYHTIQVSVS